MCTSFVYRGDDSIIAMNYDNHGMNLKLQKRRSDLFLVTLHSLGMERPLLGLRNDGIFANQQVVNPCDAGRFRLRPRTLHTSTMVGNALALPVDKLEAYIERHTIVDPPKFPFGIHMMIANLNGTSYIIEPGRGIIRYGADERFFVMSNCSICDYRKTGEWTGYGIDRQNKAEEMLRGAGSDFSVKDAFEVLDAVHQTGDEWPTELSLVYSQKESRVYYCYNHNFDSIEVYPLDKPAV